MDGVLIPSVSQKPVKSLRKIFDYTASVHSMLIELKTRLSAVDKSGLPGKFKAWIYKHGIPPRILWSVLMYEVPS